MIRINFSGHPVPSFPLAPLVGANLPVTDGGSLAELIRELLLALPDREALLRGEAAEVVLPAVAGAVGILLAEWLGQFGSLPFIRWAVTAGPDRSFSWPEATRIDLQEVRHSARQAR